ncbi:HNH endonuclease signature motif containing protein [Anaerospora sp.]|uniref:HNH endonuclease n=1 Tax=Anaerospora sp. TaxID=1960278 RepID=UPI002899956C|nr:HNH endonuclease signature motif containing protein [Anaerospora sp.]
MNPNRIKMGHYASYYFANIVDGILTNQISYLISLNDFYGEGKIQWFAEPFQRYSAFHQFIHFIVETIIDEETNNVDLKSMQKNYLDYREFMPEDELEKITILPVDEYFNNYGIENDLFEEWLRDNSKNFLSATMDDIYDYLSSLYECGEILELIEKITEEVFFVMFSNRKILLIFNEMMARILVKLNLNEIEPENRPFFKHKCILKRVSIPSWAKKAVFYRDRGRCVKCNKDVSGTLSFQNKLNYDHIIPLASGGLNDISNLQLLCEECNKRKLHFTSETSLYYEKWY